MLQIGTEVMMPLGGGYTALRAPSKLREMQVSTKKVVDPEFDQSRRDFGKTAALSGAGLALGIPAVKQAMKHGDTVVKATPTPAPSGRWNFISDDIYHSRATVGGIDRVHPWARGRLLRDSHGARSNDMVREWKTQYNESRGLSATDEWEGQVMSPGNKPKYNALQDELHQANDRVSHRLNEEMYELSDAEYDHLDDIFREQEGIPDLVDDIQSLVDKDPGVLAYKQQRHQAMMDDIGDELWNIRRSQIQEEIDSIESYIRRKKPMGGSKENLHSRQLRMWKEEMVEHERLGNRAEAYPPKRVSQKSSVHFNVPSNTSNLNISAKGFLDRGKAALQHVIKHLKPEIAEKIPVEQIEKAIEAAPKPKPKPLAPDQQFAEQLGAPNNFLSPPRAQRVKIKNDRAPRKGTRGLHNDMEHGAWPRDMGSLRDVIEDVQATGKLPQELPDEVVEAIRRADFGYDELDLYDMTHVYVPKNPLKKRVMDRVENREILGRYEEFNPPSPDDNYRELKF